MSGKKSKRREKEKKERALLSSPPFVTHCNAVVFKGPTSKYKDGRHPCSNSCRVDEDPWLCTGHRKKFVKEQCDARGEYRWFQRRVPLNSASAEAQSDSELDDALLSGHEDEDGVWRPKTQAAEESIEGEVKEAAEIEAVVKDKGADAALAAILARLEVMNSQNAALAAQVGDLSKKVLSLQKSPNKKKRRAKKIVSSSSSASSSSDSEEASHTSSGSEGDMSSGEEQRRSNAFIDQLLAADKADSAGGNSSSPAGGGKKGGGKKGRRMKGPTVQLPPQLSAPLPTPSAAMEDLAGFGFPMLLYNARRVLDYCVRLPYTKRAPTVKDKLTKKDRKRCMLKLVKGNGGKGLADQLVAKASPPQLYFHLSLLSFNASWANRKAKAVTFAKRGKWGSDAINSIHERMDSFSAVIAEMAHRWAWKDLGMYIVVCLHFWHATDCLPLGDLAELWALRVHVSEYVSVEPDTRTSPLPQPITAWHPKTAKDTCARCSLHGWKQDKCPRCHSFKDASAKACLDNLISKEIAAGAVK